MVYLNLILFSLIGSTLFGVFTVLLVTLGQPDWMWFVEGLVCSFLLAVPISLELTWRITGERP